MKEKAQQLGILDRTIMPGQMADVSAWYQAMDCFVLPSLFEGLPVVGIEAQAAGLPCVFSDRVTDEVLLSPEACRISLDTNDSEWARQIAAARQPKTNRLQGMETVRRAGYDIHKEARKLQEIYLEMEARAYSAAQPES